MERKPTYRMWITTNPDMAPMHNRFGVDGAREAEINLLRNKPNARGGAARILKARYEYLQSVGLGTYTRTIIFRDGDNQRVWVEELAEDELLRSEGL
jgi:hypothetical protein